MKAKLREMGLRQTDLADMVRASQPTITNILNGKIAVSVLVEPICEELQIPLPSEVGTRDVELRISKKLMRVRDEQLDAIEKLIDLFLAGESD